MDAHLQTSGVLSLAPWGTQRPGSAYVFQSFVWRGSKTQILEHDLLAEKELHWKGSTEEIGPTIKSWVMTLKQRTNPGHTIATFFLLQSFRSSGISLNYRAALCYIGASGFSNKTVRQSLFTSLLPFLHTHPAQDCILLGITLLSVFARHYWGKGSELSRARTVSMPDTWKGLICISNNLICSFSSLMDLLYKPYKQFVFLPSLSVSSSMLNIFSSDLLRPSHVYILWIQCRVLEKIPEYWHTVI